MKTGAGTLEIDCPISSGTASTLTVSAGDAQLDADAAGGGTANSALIVSNAGATANFTASQHLASISLSTGGAAAIAPGAGRVLVLGALDVDSAQRSQLDLANGGLIVHGGDLNAVRSLLAAGYANGSWSGPGVVSSIAAANPTHATSLGFITGADYLAFGSDEGLFDGQTVASGDVLVKYTYNGDVTLDGAVDLRDYRLMDASYLQGYDGVTKIAHWVNGDFNYDGIVNYKDYALADAAMVAEGNTILANEMAQLHAAEFGQNYINAFDAAVPEPASLSLLAIGAAGLLARLRMRVR